MCTLILLTCIFIMLQKRLKSHFEQRLRWRWGRLAACRFMVRVDGRSVPRTWDKLPDNLSDEARMWYLATIEYMRDKLTDVQRGLRSLPLKELTCRTKPTVKAKAMARAAEAPAAKGEAARDRGSRAIGARASCAPQEARVARAHAT